MAEIYAQFFAATIFVGVFFIHVSNMSERSHLLHLIHVACNLFDLYD